MRGSQVSVNSVQLDSFEVDAKHFLPDISIKQAGIFVIINSTDFAVKWDGSTRVYITASSSLKGLMKGLCGNNDGDLTNDMMTSQGIVSSDWSNVADSWKQSANCPNSINLFIDDNNPCAGKETRQAWAQAKCSVITDENEENPFYQCISKMDKTTTAKYYTQCMFDSCK